MRWIVAMWIHASLLVVLRPSPVTTESTERAFHHSAPLLDIGCGLSGPAGDHLEHYRLQSVAK